LDALQSEPTAVGAYDRVPFASATAVFLMDTASEVFVIHRAQVHHGNAALPPANCSKTLAPAAQYRRSEHSRIESGKCLPVITDG
jgi:hypothetical protein